MRCYLIILLGLILINSCEFSAKNDSVSDSSVVLKDSTRRDSVGSSYSYQGDIIYPEDSMPDEDYYSKQKDKLSAQLNGKTVFSKECLDSLKSEYALEYAHSEDKKLWYFCWFMETGGTMNSFMGVYCYLASDGKYKVFYDESQEMQIGKIYKLPHPTKALYLTKGGTKTCSTCATNFVEVIEIQSDSLNFKYPAFGAAPAFWLGYRIGDLYEFDYDVQTQVLKYVYMVDDNTPVPEDVKVEDETIISGQQEWRNGKFIESHKILDSYEEQ